VKARQRFLSAALIACLAGYIYAYASGRAGVPIRSDAFSYYVYLPAWALHHDPSLQAVADDCCGGEFPAWTNINRWPLRREWVNAHPIGEAILIAPFFAVAHALTRWTNLSPDGFTPYYQHGAGLAGLFYAIAGLWFLRRLLQRYFTPGVTAATLIALLAGTSLYHYATFDSTWSHAFTFALFAAFLERFDARRPGRVADDVVLGAIAGLLILVRHTNALIPICFYGSDVVSAFRRKLQMRKFIVPIVPALVATLVVLPQLWIYHRATGRWFVSSYGDLGFTFLSPHVAGVLVSPTKGLFFYAPLLLFAIPGLFALPGRLREWRPAIAVLLLVNTYLIASWFDWQFGASYGHRGFVDFYPAFALGLAVTFTRAAARPPLRAAMACAVIVLCALSLFQMLQYWHGILPMSDVTWAQYRELFLRWR
jgi:hypothetical protein